MELFESQLFSAPPAAERILVIRLGAIGDVVRTVPSLRVLRRAYPKAYIAWAVEDRAKDVLIGHPDLDEVLVLWRSRWQGDGGVLRVLRRATAEVLRFAADARRKRFDLILDFHGIAKSGLVARACGSGLRVGYARPYAKELNTLFTNLQIRLLPKKLSRFDRNAALVRAIGVEESPEPPFLFPDETERRPIEEYFAASLPAEDGPVVVMHPGTSEKTRHKRWFPESYAAVADRLAEEAGGRIVLSWGPGELSIAKEVKERMRRKAMIGPETKTLGMLAALFGRAQLYVGGDTGPMHVASLVGTPVVAIYGPTDPIENEPYRGTPFAMVREEVDCCRSRRCSSQACMHAISPDRVSSAALELLGKTYKR